MPKRTIAIVAGEASADLHAAHLIRALRALLPDCRVWGMGGREMRAAGAEIIVDADRLSVVGITEVVAKVPLLFKAMSRLKQQLTATSPDLLVLLDFPDFNLHLAKFAKQAGIRVLYYISPQIWAWRSGRVKKIKARVDHMAVILPFEEAFYREHGVPATFVGHPLMDGMPPGDAAPCARPPLPPSPLVLGLLPGSRDREVCGLLPLMLQAGQMLVEKCGPILFKVSCAPSIDPAMVTGIVARYPSLDATVTDEPVSTLMPRCHLAVVASGTVTLEGALYTTPMVITYVVSPMSYRLGRALVHVDHIGLVNLIAERRIVPELVQHEVTPGALADTVHAIVADPRVHEQMCRDLAEVRQRLGQSGASGKVARLACALMGEGDAL